MLEAPELGLDAASLPVQITVPLGSDGTSGCRRVALRHMLPGLHSPVGQRHLVALRW